MIDMLNEDKIRFGKLKEYYMEHGVFPPYSAIAKLIGYKSKNSVFEFIDRMKSCGRISTTPENRIKPGKYFMNDEW